MKTPSRRTLALCASLAVFAVIVFYFWRDLRLGLNPADIEIPDIVVENIEIRRVLSGDEWHLLSPRAEHRQGMIYGKSVDITVTAENGDVSKLFALNGFFSRENNNVTLEGLSADLKQENKSVTMIAGRAYYDSDGEKWYFSDDVTISDGSVRASGPEGLYSVKEGLSVITGGGTVTWIGQ